MEQSRLINFLNAGKGLYIEGCDFGFDNYTTQLYQKFGCTYLGDGNSSGNVSSVTGQSSTIVEGKSYDYLYGQGPDFYVDYIGANGGTIFFTSQDNRGRAVNYDGGGTYRSIHSTSIFGALRNGTYDKDELMGIYMDYLCPTGVEELADTYVRNLSIFPNPASQNVNLNFTLPYAGKVKIKVYNIAGQMVRQIIDGALTKGSHKLTWNGNDDSGKSLNSGKYILRIEINKEVINKVVVLVK